MKKKSTRLGWLGGLTVLMATACAGVGDQVRGGALYDTWWVVAGIEAPAADHPLWATRPDSESNTRGGPTTWRCKECHGWDYKGAGGAYATGSHRTGFAGVLDGDWTIPSVVETLRTGHGYGAAGLTDDDLTNLAAFVTAGLVDTALLINADGRFVGDPAAGRALYADSVAGEVACASCHGADGLQVPGDAADFDDYPGKIARKNPWELVHKIRFGQPGTDMPALAEHLSPQQLADLGAYLQSLPAHPTAGRSP